MRTHINYTPRINRRREILVGGERFHDLIYRHAATQKEFSLKVGIDYTCISRHCKPGPSVMRVSTLRLIARRLDIDSLELRSQILYVPEPIEDLKPPFPVFGYRRPRWVGLGPGRLLACVVCPG